MRCPQRPCCGRSRFGVPRHGSDPRVRGRLGQRRRPCGFTPCEHDAVKLDMRTCRLRFSHTRTRHDAAAVTTCARNVGNVFDRPARIDRRTRFDHAQRRPVISSATASFVRRPPPVMHRRMLLRDVPLPTPDLRGLAGRVVLPSVRPTALLGFKALHSQSPSLRRLAPASGGRPFLVRRAHVPVRPIATPRLIFVGSIRPPAE
jgi:hypothetical protein